MMTAIPATRLYLELAFPHTGHGRGSAKQATLNLKAILFPYSEESKPASREEMVYCMNLIIMPESAGK